MKVLVVTHNYPRYPDDPAGAFIARLSRGVAAAGHAVLVVAPHAPGLETDFMDGSVTVRRFRYGPDARETVAYTGDMRTAPKLALWRFVRAYRGAVRAAVREFRPDLVHAHWWFPGGWAAADAGTPAVVTCHGTDVRLLDGSRLARWLARRVFRGAAAVTTVSEFLARDLARLAGGDVPPPSVTRMPVDVDAFSRGRSVAKAQPPRILFVGNLNPSKGADILVRAARILRDRSVAHRVRIVGDGQARPALESLVASLDLRETVEFAGWVPLNRMAEEYGAATVTVLPTRGNAEGLGLALVEALLAGSAVVGSPAGGIPEVVVPGETGLIARDGDPADLADQLARMLADRELREGTSARGRDRMARTFSLENTLPGMLEIYRGAAGRTAA